MWEKWRSPEGDVVETCCLLTTSPNSVLAPIHDRMPVLLDDEAMTRWLDPSIEDPATLADLLVPCPPERLGGHPVSMAVNSVRNDDPRCIEEEAEPVEIQPSLL
jgi:putative SOS response-associated peptidase YedK